MTAELEIADSITGTGPISLLAEFSHDKRRMTGKKETSAGLDVSFHVAADHICSRNLLVFKTGFVFLECACPVETARWKFLSPQLLSRKPVL